MKPRPLSPHLQVYRWEWTMFYSIAHRASGVFLSLGAFLLVAWLVALASGEAAFTTMQMCLGSVIGRLLLFGWSWALFYHLINGCRHLIWDSGSMLGLKAARLSGHIGFALSLVLTVAVWLVAYNGGF